VTERERERENVPGERGARRGASSERWLASRVAVGYYRSIVTQWHRPRVTNRCFDAVSRTFVKRD
jgi:hypothetical protein